MSVPTAARAAPAGWASRGACLDSDPDLFFPIAPTGPGLQQIAQAKAVCARCPVRRECLQYALATHQVHGVWGGTSEEERQRLRSRGPDGRPGFQHALLAGAAFAAAPALISLRTASTHQDPMEAGPTDLARDTTVTPAPAAEPSPASLEI